MRYLIILLSALFLACSGSKKIQKNEDLTKTSMAANNTIEEFSALVLDTNSSGFLKFNSNNFISLLPLNKAEWENNLKAYGFIFFGDGEGELMYLKGEYGKTWQTAIYDYKMGTFGLVWWDVVNKKKMTRPLRLSMPEKPEIRNDQSSMYRKDYLGKTYTIIISSFNDKVYEEVRFGYR